ncbi:hypothetical protein MSMEG_6170 [Mycolicibacterium smegmatis MC2 155]|uniref:Uncharacterized protein n=1 Tax=Mycolicibacterium smegmatis (strain ATCC 700084 / mc(2)155) TaxID=246196 RepID=A0R5F1_MYCS2|nr:hypothetical protein MSMEG_6170 [Mycolicibacterium smegmatis MC2 155]
MSATGRGSNQASAAAPTRSPGNIRRRRRRGDTFRGTRRRRGREGQINNAAARASAATLTASPVV